MYSPHSTLVLFGDADHLTRGVLNGLALFLGWIAYLALSRIYFHPLSRFPGPVLAALTGYYVTYFDIVKNGRNVQHLERLHKRYGPVVRCGPNKLHFANPAAYDEIYRNTKFPKEDWFYNAFATRDALFGCTDLRAAKERANMLRPLFSRRKVLDLENVIQQVIDRFIHSLSQKAAAHDVIDIYRGFSSITMEVITTYCFAKKYGMVEYPEFAHPAMVGFQESTFVVFLMQHFPWIRPILFNMPAALTNAGAAGRKLFIKTLLDQITEILKDPTSLSRSDHEIIYHHLLSQTSKESGQPLSESALGQHAVSLVAAGTETVANACTMALFHVLKNPEMYNRLRDELKRAWEDVDVPMALEKLEKLPYLTAVIHEALRLSHGVVTPLPRVVLETTSIAGVEVPAGTVVSMGQSFIHLNPDIFSNPTKFDPDRWLGENAKGLETYLVPFSRGPRICIGMNLAWAELYLILGNLFRKASGITMVDMVDEHLEYRSLLTPRYKKHVKVMIDAVEGVVPME